MVRCRCSRGVGHVALHENVAVDKLNHLLILSPRFICFVHLKLELLTQFPASNDGRDHLFAKNLLNRIDIRLAKHLSLNISFSTRADNRMTVTLRDSGLISY